MCNEGSLATSKSGKQDLDIHRSLLFLFVSAREKDGGQSNIGLSSTDDSLVERGMD